MEAIIVATDQTADQISWGKPACLIPLVDRPILQHVIERLVRHETKRIHIIVGGQHAEDIRTELGDGSRWGIELVYHEAQNPAFPFFGFPVTDWSGAGAPVVIARGDELLYEELSEAISDAEAGHPRIYVTGPGGRRWTGWGVLPRSYFSAIPTHTSYAFFGALFLSLDGKVTKQRTDRTLTSRTWNELLDAQRAILSGEMPDLLVSGLKAPGGGWISGRAFVHARAKVHAPSFIAEHAMLGPGVEVGPYAVVGSNCILRNGCRITDSMLLPGSYIGADLHISRAVINGRKLASARLKRIVAGLPDSAIGSLDDLSLANRLRGLSSRLGGLLLFTLFLPLFLVTYLVLRATQGQEVLSRRTILRLPARENSKAGRLATLHYFRGALPSEALRSPLVHFLFRFIPGLLSVMRGDLAVTGVEPMSPVAADRLHPQRRPAYLRERAGLVSEAWVSLRRPGRTVLESSARKTRQSNPIGLLLTYFGLVLLAFLKWPSHWHFGAQPEELKSSESL